MEREELKALRRLQFLYVNGFSILMICLFFMFLHMGYSGFFSGHIF